MQKQPTAHVMLGCKQQHCWPGAATFATAGPVQHMVKDMLQQACNKRRKETNQLTATEAVLGKTQ